MTTQNKQKGFIKESHIINGSANLRLNFEQFYELTEDQQKDFLWYTIVQKKLNIPYACLIPEAFPAIFENVTNGSKEEAKATLDINGFKATSAAQVMTLIAYGDTCTGEKSNIPFRSLDYNVKCEDFADLIKCFEIIESYNDFDADRIKNTAFWALNLKHYLNENNPNNGKDLFKFHIARESSPAFYVSWNEYFDSKIITDTDGCIIYWEEYTKEDFKASMMKLKNEIGADEFSIKETEGYGGSKYYEARFWFD